MRKFNITVNGEVYEVEVEEMGEEGTIVTPQPRRAAPAQAAKPAAKPVSKPAARKAAPSAGSVSISAPMPGVILDVRVSEGQAVKNGDVLLILEAMKMENEVMAPQDGTIESVSIAKGSNVNAGDVMIVIK